MVILTFQRQRYWARRFTLFPDEIQCVYTFVSSEQALDPVGAPKSAKHYTTDFDI